MSARIDRRTALRRAAAPSLDFSLMPDASAVQALLDAANRDDDQPATAPQDAREALLRAANSVPPRESDPGAEPFVAADADADDEPRFRRAPTPSDAPVPLPRAVEVPERFRMRARPAGRTLQPLDAPPALGLQRSVDLDADRPLHVDPVEDDVELGPALTFVRAHRGAAYERNAKPRLNDIPTLILFGRDENPTQDLSPSAPQPGTARDDDTDPTPVALDEALRRRPTNTLKPGARDGSAVTLTPTGEEILFWDSAPQEPVDEVPLFALEEDDSLAEDIDPELDRFLARRGRSRFFAAVGVVIAMGVLLAAAAAGLAVMAQPALLDGGNTATEAPLPPPPRPAMPGQ